MLDQIAFMTWKNPIFMLVFFSVLWYLPGLIARRRRDYLIDKSKKEQQKKNIEKLYPKQ
ncbi:MULTISPECIES: hypothetical protein [unclassified Prochlorococcus]|uniref:hypothetical protein n=1 Tax=unclassified Prochlorococcus TaxID=2627481 RepID=UPI0005339099|nr:MULTISPECIES: hypothetical protein [unclassified Prochlorococcus]KGG15231.1 hypothetical protein EV06_1100 [Prochlorococcus sp. MIT 0602]